MNSTQKYGPISPPNAEPTTQSDASFAFCLGPFAEAVKDGLWLLLDEANLAQDAVLRVIEDVLARGYLRIGTGGVALPRRSI